MVMRAGTIALVGRPNVGKSTLVNAIVGQPVAITSPHPQTTRDRIAGILTTKTAQLVFLDTPGLQIERTPKTKLGVRMNAVARGAAEECDVALFVTDAAACASDRDILAAVPAATPVVLALNKVDRVKGKAALLPTLEAHAKARDYAALVPISAKKGSGVERLVDVLATLLPEGEPRFPEDELSDRPLRFFVAELVREQVLMQTREEVPHGVAVTIDAFEEGRDGSRVAATIHVAKTSHKGILIGDGGRRLRAIGSAARRRAEVLVGQKVHLALFVRATPKWFDDPVQLVELGYDRLPSAAGDKRRA